MEREQIRGLIRRDTDWEFVVRVAHEHRVIPLLNKSLSMVGSEAIPSSVLERLRAVSAAVAQRNDRLTAELVWLLALLDGHGIGAVPFKGPVLAAQAYGDVSLRQFGDLDILIADRDVLAAQRVLCEQGYSVLLREFADPDHRARRRGAVRSVPSFSRYRLDYDCVLVREEPRVWLELHWRVLPWYYFAPQLPAGAVATVPLSGTTVRSLPVEELLLLVCLHGTKHCWERLAWICDVGELVGVLRGADWEGLVAEALRLGGGRCLALGLFLAKDLIGARLPGDVWRWARGDAVVLSLAAQVRRQFFGQRPGRRWLVDLPLPLVGHTPGELLFHLRAKERGRDRLRYTLGLSLGAGLEMLRTDRLAARFSACLRWCHLPTSALSVTTGDTS